MAVFNEDIYNKTKQVVNKHGIGVLFDGAVSMHTFDALAVPKGDGIIVDDFKPRAGDDEDY